MPILRNLVGATVLVGATTLVTTQVVSQQNADQMKEAGEMMEMWMKMGEPGPEHARMAEQAGTWHQENTYWFYPGAEPQTSTSEARLKSIMGGRFMIQSSKGSSEFMGQKMEFEGLGIFGYDNMKRKYVFSWIDNMGTLIMNGEGEADASGNVITFMSELPNPMTGGTMKVKMVQTNETDDRHTLEMHEQHPDGSWHKNMHIVSTRKP